MMLRGNGKQQQKKDNTVVDRFMIWSNNGGGGGGGGVTQAFKKQRNRRNRRKQSQKEIDKNQNLRLGLEENWEFSNHVDLLSGQQQEGTAQSSPVAASAGGGGFGSTEFTHVDMLGSTNYHPELAISESEDEDDMSTTSMSSNVVKPSSSSSAAAAATAAEETIEFSHVDLLQRPAPTRANSNSNSNQQQQPLSYTDLVGTPVVSMQRDEKEQLMEQQLQYALQASKATPLPKTTSIAAKQARRQHKKEEKRRRKEERLAEARAQEEQRLELEKLDQQRLEQERQAADRRWAAEQRKRAAEQQRKAELERKATEIRRKREEQEEEQRRKKAEQERQAAMQALIDFTTTLPKLEESNQEEDEEHQGQEGESPTSYVPPTPSFSDRSTGAPPSPPSFATNTATPTTARALTQPGAIAVGPVRTASENLQNEVFQDVSLSEQQGLVSSRYRSAPVIDPLTDETMTDLEIDEQEAMLPQPGAIAIPISPSVERARRVASMVLEDPMLEPESFHDEELEERSNRERRELVATVLSNTSSRRFFSLPQRAHSLPMVEAELVKNSNDGIYVEVKAFQRERIWCLAGVGFCIGGIGVVVGLIMMLVAFVFKGGSAATPPLHPDNEALSVTLFPTTSPTGVISSSPTSRLQAITTLQPTTGSAPPPPPPDLQWDLIKEIAGNGDLDDDVPGEEWGYTVSLSNDGSVLAIGSTKTANGNVRIFHRNSTNAWNLFGNPIEGKNAGDFAGVVRVSGDGNTAVIGAFGNDDASTGSGHVRVFKINEGMWKQVGQDIVGAGLGDESGWSVAISDDGTIVAIGAHRNDGAGTDSGHLRVFALPDEGPAQWEQLGQDLEGLEDNDFAGWSVDISGTGRIVAYGAVNAAWVRSFSWDAQRNTWKAHGQGIVGDTTKDQTGYSVSLSYDGWTMAIGETLWDTVGRVRVFAFNGLTLQWDLLGDPIVGDNPRDAFGTSVSLTSDGRTVAISAMGYDDESNLFHEGSNVGMTYVYTYFNGDWKLLGDSIRGTEEQEVSGWRNAVSLSKDGSTLAIGAPRNSNHSGKQAGVVRVYEKN